MKRMHLFAFNQDQPRGSGVAGNPAMGLMRQNRKQSFYNDGNGYLLSHARSEFLMLKQ
jgi:hypothetical protein